MALDTDHRQELPDALKQAVSLPEVLLPYQVMLLQTTAQHSLVVCEKSRRIGMTWAVGADAVLTAAAKRSADGMDVLYIGYNLDMAREFIDTCAMWARAFVPAAQDVEEFMFSDQTEGGQDKSINAFRIKFAAGFEITALSSKPRSLRGRQGYVIFDEAAFHDDLNEILKAAMAFLVWGGKVLVISTHDGADNSFNELVHEIRSARRKGEVLRVTFDDALSDGLYERIALKTGKPATEAAKQDWIADIMAMYGDDADEELHCIPKAGTGTYFSTAAIEACMSPAHAVARLTCPQGFELRPAGERRTFVDDWLKEHVAPHLAALDPTRLAALGEDFGRSSDLTVLAIGQEMADMSVVIPLIIELKNMPIEQQKQVLRFVIEALERFLAAHFDATGNGLGLAEWAQENWGFDRIEAVKITAQWYLTHGPMLKGHIEDQTIEMVRDADIRDDIRSMRLVRGIPTIPDKRNKGRHGDALVAILMLLAALKSDIHEYAYTAVPGVRSRYAPSDDDRPGNDGDDRQKGAW